MMAIIASLLLFAQSPIEDGLSLIDLPAYKAALDGRDESKSVPVTFRELWERPKDYRGRRVRVEGRIVRHFQAPASGELPPRVELWLATANNDVMCVVFPEPGRSEQFPENLSVAMEGTSLGLVRYSGGEVARYAPLIVGCRVPSRITNDSTAPRAMGWQRTDWFLAALALVIAAMLLARAHLRRPARPRIEIGPPIEFEDGPGEGTNRDA